jgi:hypothetical protein
MTLRLFQYPGIFLAAILLAGCASRPHTDDAGATRQGLSAQASRIDAICAEWEAEGSSPTRRTGGLSRSSPLGDAYRGETVSAAWWLVGNTGTGEAIQAAIDSGAKTVLIPASRSPWMLTGTVVLKGGQELIFESGCLVLARPGSFMATNAPLFSARDLSGLRISGYGATLRMRKRDYQKPPYPASQWRHVLSLKGVKGVLVEGLTIESSGGDGVYVGTVDGTPSRQPCEDLTLHDLRILDNHRQGISLISGTRILIENCTIERTNGTLPMAGIDFEPNGADPGFQDCTVRNCRIEGNSGPGILFAFDRAMKTASPQSIRIENCAILDPPIAVSVLKSGTGNRIDILFTGCSFEGLRYIQHAEGLTVRMR